MTKQATLTLREKQLIKQCKLLNFFGSGCGKCDCDSPKDCKLPEAERNVLLQNLLRLNPANKT